MSQVLMRFSALLCFFQHRAHKKAACCREAARLVARSREAVHTHLQRQQEARQGSPPPTWEPPLLVGSPTGSPQPLQTALLPLQAW